MPSFYGGQNFAGLFCPLERPWVLIVFVEEPSDRVFEFLDRSEHATGKAPLRQLGKKAFDSVEPGGGCRREVESPPRMRLQPFAHLQMFMGGVVVDDCMDMLAGWYSCLYGVEKADIFLVPVFFHAAADNFSVQHVDGSKQSGRAMPLIVVRHRAAAALFQRQARLCAVECLDLAFLVDGKHNGMGRRADVEANNIAQLDGKFGIIGKLEVARAVRLQAMPAPNPLHRTHADALNLGHGGHRPVRRLARRRVRECCLHDPRLHRRPEWRNARRTGLVAQQARDALGHEAFLPAPDSRFAGAAAAHDLGRAAAIGSQQDNLRPPDMFLRAVPIGHNRFQFGAVLGGYGHCDTIEHTADSHLAAWMGILNRTQMLDFIHYGEAISFRIKVMYWLCGERRQRNYLRRHRGKNNLSPAVLGSG